MQNTRHLAVPLVLLVALTPNRLQAQQNEIPPALEEASTTTATTAEGTRIVEGRPRLYSIKRVAHPVSWFEAGISPVIRLAEKFAPDASKEKQKKAPRDSGIKFGAKGLGAGSGFGPEVKLFHKNLFDKGIEFELPAVVTYKFYEKVGFRLNYPLFAGAADRVGVELTGDYVSRPSDSFFGIGNDTPRTQSRFRTVSRSTGLALDARFQRWSARVGTGFRSIGVTEPRKFISAADAFQGQAIPGLTEGGTMIVSTASLGRDTTDHPHLPASGGVQTFGVSLNEGQRGGDFSYWRYGMELQQFLPLSADRRKVIGLRFNLETNQAKGGSAVPFFDLPTIGSRTTVRGFGTRRFTDRSAMSASVDYRYRIWRYFDWGLFVDGGQVAPEIGDFAMDRFHTAFGMRFVPRSQDGRGIIVDVARSREAWMFYIDFSPLF